MITYREATPADAESIARLHSLSWQQTYRGALSDEFLNGPVLENRRHIWRDRLKQPAPDQYIIIAESSQSVCGFGCAYLARDPVWGTLLDNLHVRHELKGYGIGRVLLESAARWSYQKNPALGFYLWVLVKNKGARKFYDHLGGINQELASHEFPDGSFADCFRYVWPTITTLL